MTIHPDERLLVELRQRQLTPHGRAQLRERTKVEHSLAHIGHWQGRRARYLGPRKNLFDLRRPRSSTTFTSSPANHPALGRPHDYLAGARLVHLPAVADGVPAGASGLGQQRREPLDPPGRPSHGRPGATLGEELLDISVGQAEAQVPADSEHDDLGREAEAGNDRSRKRSWQARRRLIPAVWLLDASPGIQQCPPVVSSGQSGSLLHGRQGGHPPLTSPLGGAETAWHARGQAASGWLSVLAIGHAAGPR